MILSGTLTTTLVANVHHHKRKIRLLYSTGQSIFYNHIEAGYLMSLKTYRLTVTVLFIVGALARSVAIGLGQVKIGDLFGLVSMFAIMSMGVGSLVLQSRQKTTSTMLQRVGGLLSALFITIISLVFCLSLLMHLFS